MKRDKMKRLFVAMVGVFAGNISVLGLYPIGIAYMTSGYLERVYRYLLFPIVVISMAFSASTLQVAKYGLSMVVVMLIIGMIEKIKPKCHMWLAGAIAGVSVAIMEVLDYLLLSHNNLKLIQGLAEAAMIVSLTVLFSRVMGGFLREEQEAEPEEEVKVLYNPGKDKIMESAKAFRNLANTFYGMPNKKDRLTKEDLEQMMGEVSGEICCTCEKWQDCWDKHYTDTYKSAYDIWDVVEQKGEVITEDMKHRIEKRCIRSSVFLEETKQIFKRAQLNLVWNNRLIENREAVADQLKEMAGIMTGVAEEVYDAPSPDEELEAQLQRKLKLAHVKVQKIIVLKRDRNRTELHITMKTNGNHCIATKELEGIISKVCGKEMVSSKDSRSIVNKEYCTIVFIDDVSFKTLYAVARATKSRESISGDNFSFMYTNNGKLLMSLSDGMGSGIKAYKESAQVVDLLEQFMEAGFQKETAVKMINSSLAMRANNPYFSTIDISDIDLYDGVCEFLKVGASTTFIRRDNWVETISSTSLPAGVFQQLELENISKKLYDGDFVVMMSDGVLDALPIDNQEVVIQNMIMEADTNNPKQMANELMEKILPYVQGEPKDDMTILVTGIWKK